MEYYKTESEKLEAEVRTLYSKYSMLGTMRLIVFIIMLVGLVVGLYDSKPLFLVIGVIGIIGFTALVFIHGKTNEQLEYMRAKLLVFDSYIKRFGEDWKKFKEDGHEYLDEDDLVARDMDIMGPSSLYQFICVAGTEDGRQMLAKTLKNPEYSTEDIVKRQEAISELCNKKDFSFAFETLCVKSNTGKKKKYSSDEFVKYCSSNEHIPKIFNVLRFLLPCVTLALFVLGILGVINLGFTLISFFAILLFSWVTSGASGEAIMPMISFGYIIDDYIRMFELISNESFDSELLNDIKNTISEDSGALSAIKKLERISAAFNIRYNPLVHQILCGLVMWDFHLGFMMDKWRDKNGAQVGSWINAVSHMEELMSFAVLARTREVSYPLVTRENKVSVTARNMRHPLIEPDKVVPNDVSFKGGTTIITGSNMSGKTTFLRTLGINLVLAYAGAPVCASDMKTDYMKIFTSMRVTDDVSNGISTFYAEILRIKTMVEYKKNEAPMLCLIDEIFKGTNSADRIVGASQVIKKLSDEYSMTIVSTHDFELCDLKSSKGVPAVNYHFEEYYEGDQLKFDYKKKDGRCTTTNAMAILHMAGLD